MTALTDLALEKRTVAIAVVLLVVLAGLWAASSLTMELLPNIEVPIVSVVVVYPGADPQSVLDEVTIPIESSIAGTRGLRQLRSTAESGLSVTVAEFEYGTKMKDTLASINQSISAIQLPDAAMQPKASDFDFNTLPILRLSLTGDEDVRKLGDTAENVFKPRLEAVDGVHSVEIVGKVDKQILVSLDSDKMAQAKIDVAQVSGILQANNIFLPSGDILENNRDVPIRTGYRITSTQQIEDLMVRPATPSQMGGIPGMGLAGSGGMPSGPQMATTPQTGAPGAQGPSSTGGQSYSVQPGDTLWSIAQRQYGDGSMSQAIFEANRDKLASPDLLQPGVELTIPPPPQSGAAPSTSAPSIQTPSALPQGQPQGQPPIRIKDIATVKIVDADNAATSRTNGHPSIGLSIYRNPGANTVKVADKVKQTIDEILQETQGVEITVIEDSSQQIRQSINDLAREAMLGAFFAIVVIYLFLTSARTTMIAGASIPLSILITFILLNAFGMSLNMMTLGGMTVAVGRVVDDTVVVLENIYRHSHRGEGIFEAIRGGVGEVAAAITSSTLTTVGVFLPLAFVGGIVGEIFRPFALTASFALLASLLVALTAIPAISSFLSGQSSKATTKDTWLQRLYTPVIRWSLRRKRISISLAVFVLLASFASLPFIGTTFLPSSNEKLLQVSVELPPGTDKDTTINVATEVEGAISQIEGVEFYQTNVGSTGSILSVLGSGAGNSSTADISVRLSESSDVQQTATKMREALSQFASSATITVSPLDASGTGSNNLEVVLSGSDYTALKKASSDVLEKLKDIDGLTNPQSDIGAAKPEVSVAVDPEKAIQHGTTAAQVATKVRQMIVGQVATTVNLGNQSLDVLVKVRPEDANSVEKLKKLAVGTVDAVPLSEIADVRVSDGPVRLTRRDQKAAITITGSITKANTGAVNAAVSKAVSEMDLPAGINVEYGGVVEQQTEGFSSLGLALIAAIALVYIIMMATMGSLLDPLVILVTLPLASIGAFLSLLITGRTLGMASMIGMLMLIGIVVTNAIVLLDLVRRLRSQGLEIEDALVEAGRTRVRPILMTAGATVLALVPSALGLSEGSMIATEMATVVIGGLTTSTMLTLVVVPVVYSMANGFRENKGKSDKPSG